MQSGPANVAASVFPAANGFSLDNVPSILYDKGVFGTLANLANASQRNFNKPVPIPVQENYNAIASLDALKLSVT